jgi:rubrerythrin
MSTQDNLKSAFAGESQASRKYLYFAERAEKEGLPQIARLFRAASEAETVHARNHLEAVQGIGTTEDNLKAAIHGEHYEFTEMYPPFVAEARAEGNRRAEMSLIHANEVEKTHHRLYREALASLERSDRMPEGPYYVCPVCGETVFGKAPDACAICRTPGSKWKKID